VNSAPSTAPSRAAHTTNYLLFPRARDNGSFLYALDEIINWPSAHIKDLRGDDEKAFGSRESKKIYQLYDPLIEWQTVDRITNQTGHQTTKLTYPTKLPPHPNHRSLAIIDRAVRTIRDLAFNLEYDEIAPPTLKYLTDVYNNSPHNTLSKTMGFFVSPYIAEIDSELELEIIRRRIAENHSIKSQMGFRLELGSRVFTQADKSLKSRTVVDKAKTVVGFTGVNYVAQDSKGQLTKISRSRLKT
jgi:hypothetical protein